MVPIKEALTFDDVTLAPKYSEILPSEVNTTVQLTKNLKLKIPLLSSAMDTVTESKMAIAIAKSGGIGVIHRNLDIKNQILEIKKVKKQKLIVGAAVGAGPNELKRAEAIIKEGVDLIVVDTAHGHTKKVGEIIKFIKKFKKNKIALCAGNIATPEAAKYLIPPSEIIFTFLFLSPFLTDKIALNLGTPIPATKLVVQIDPGPIPTLIILKPNLIKNFAASGVAILPAHKAIFLLLNFLINFIISPTFLLAP